MIDVRIYTTPSCGYCVAAKALLRAHAAPYDEIDVSAAPDQRAWLLEQTGQRTVPQIFLAGVPVGGYRELAQLASDGRLRAILDGAERPDPVAR